MTVELETLAEFDPEQIAVSRTGTRHVLRTPTECLCKFTIRPDDGLFEGSRDCFFCLDLLNAQLRKAAADAAVEPDPEPAESSPDLLAVPDLPETAA